MTSSCRLSANDTSGNNDPAAKECPSGFPFITCVTLIAAAVALFFGRDNAGAVIATLSLATIALIIYGERFWLDRKLEYWGVPGREALIPVIALATALALGAVDPAIIPVVIHSKLQIIVLILSFAILAEGINRSGFFAFAAYKIVQNCQGNTTTLTLYLYILASVLTLFTTNDVVTLVMTPVIISICANAGIMNARLLLLSEFVAANTMSMATLIGSPTNIIAGLGLNITYSTYLLIMIVPAILSGMLSLIVLDWVIKQCRRHSKGWFFGRWTFDNNYRIPSIAYHIQFTSKMRIWLALFTFSMVLVAIVSGLKMSLFFAAVPIAVLSLGAMYIETGKKNNSHKEAGQEIIQQIKSLPYSVFFFGMTFFIFAAQMVQMDFVTKVVVPFIRDHVMQDLVGASISTIMATGLLVNTINDLPASAFLTDLFQHIAFTGGGGVYMRIVIIQSMLVGLNIGCYVTPIGALAGLLFFNIIGRDEKCRKQLHDKAVQAGENPPPLETIAMPDRCDLVRFGFINFMVVAIVLGLLLPFFAAIIDLLINSPGDSAHSPIVGMISIYHYLLYIGFILTAVVVIKFREILKKGNVLLAHMREVFSVMTRVTVWTMTNRGVYMTLLAVGFLAFASLLLYWAEDTNILIYGHPGDKPLFDSISSFVLWLLVFSSAGLGGTSNPHSALGLAMTSSLTMLTIGSVVIIAQMTSDKTVQNVSRRLARGEIPGYRIAIVNYSHKCESFVEEVLYTRDASVLLLCSSSQYDRALSFCDQINATAHAGHRVHAALKNADPYYNYREYDIGGADEIYFLSDMTQEGEFENLSYISQLDTIFNMGADAVQTSADMASIGLIQADLQTSLDDLSHLPKVFIEVSSSYFQDLIRKSCSPRLLKNSLQMTFDLDISEFLISDMDESSEMLNSYYGLEKSPEDGSLFEKDKNPLERYKIKAFELDANGKDLFKKHFSGVTTGTAARLTGDMRALRHVARQVIATVPQDTGAARYLDNATLKDIDYTSLLGVVMKIKDSYMHLGIPAAAISMQAVPVEKILLRQEAGNAATPSPKTPHIGQAGNIFIFNLNPESISFIRALMPVLEERGRRIVILCTTHQIVPKDIEESPCVSILRSDVIDDFINWICPLHPQHKAIKFLAAGAAPLLQEGDRLYVFLDYSRANPELPSIDFVYQINRRLQEFESYATEHGMAPVLTHPDVYIAAEMNGPESRFLFENFFIDKIFDASLPRQNYMNVLAKIYHRALSDKTLVGHIHGTGSEFRRAAAIAQYLCRFITEYTGEIGLRDHTGGDILLTGKSYADAARDIRTYSMPPMQLFARVRITAVPENDSPFARRIFKITGVDDSEPLREDDLLLNIPVI